MFRSVIKTATFQQSQITIFGTVINGILGAFFYIFMARFLGPADFGLLIVSITTLTLIADIADFGTNTGLIRFVSSHLNSEKDKAFKFLKLGLEIKLVIWLMVLGLGIYFAPIISDYIFRRRELLAPLRLALVGVGGALLLTYATSALQSFQKYLLWSFINIASNALRLIFIFYLIFIQQLNLISGLFSYILMPFLGFSIALFFLPIGQVLSAKSEFVVAKQFFKFNTSVAIFTIIAAISSRLDTFLNTYFLTTEEIGIYGAANQLVQVVPQLVGALGVVAAPKFSSFKNKVEMLKYFKKFQFYVLGISLLITLAIPLSYFLIPIVYGVDFTKSTLPFIILLLAMIVFLISVPLHNSIIFYFGRADIFVWIAISHLLIIGILGSFMISNYGVIGTAMTVLIGIIANFLLPLLWFINKLRR